MIGWRKSLAPYAASLVLVLLGIVANIAVSRGMEGDPFVSFIIPVTLASMFFGLEAGLLTTALSAIAGWYFFIPPAFSFAIQRVADATSLGMFVASCAFLSVMTARIYHPSKN
jgi:K+-sensing histidine kinase KdpD